MTPDWKRAVPSFRQCVRSALALTVALAGCVGGSAPRRLNGGGSSLIYPLMSKWASEYARQTGVEVNYQSVGSGGGIQQMTVGTFDFGCTDAPLNDEQLRTARQAGGDVVHVPLVLGAVVPAYRLDEVDRPVRFTGSVLAEIFLGTVTRWNDPKLAEANPGLPLPDRAINVVHRSDGSGTTYLWADYLSKVSDAWRATVGVGTSLRWPCGVGQKGSEGVAGHIRRTPGALGYLELAYALQNQISYGLVQNPAGVFVEAGPATVTAAADGTMVAASDDLRFSLTAARGKEAYPISGTVWAVVRTNPPAGKGQFLVDFLRWATHEGQQHAGRLYYTPLPPQLVERVERQLARIVVPPSPQSGRGSAP